MKFADKTDINGVIGVLANLSYAIPVESKAYGIVSHPLFSSVVIKSPTDKELIILTEKTTEEINKIIGMTLNFIKERTLNDKEKPLDRLFFIFTNKPYWMMLLDFSKEYLTKRDYTEMLVSIWTQVEFPHQYGIRKCVEMFRLADRDIIFEQPIYKNSYDELPNTIKVYRGLQGGKSSVRGLSWTKKLEKARWFANRFGEKNPVYEALIDKKDVFFFTDGRSEEEVVLNPFKLKNVRLVK